MKILNHPSQYKPGGLRQPSLLLCILLDLIVTTEGIGVSGSSIVVMEAYSPGVCLTHRNHHSSYWCVKTPTFASDNSILLNKSHIVYPPATLLFMSQIELIPFVPQTASYRIFHPRNFLINESEDNIVTLTSPVTDVNLTLSGYQINVEINEEILLNFMYDKTEDYTLIWGLYKEMIGENLLIEGQYIKDVIHWRWFAISKSNQIILASINSDTELSTEDYNLFKYMLARMEIYPSEFE
jgi:hypothetical protein